MKFSYLFILVLIVFGFCFANSVDFLTPQNNSYTNGSNIIMDVLIGQTDIATPLTYVNWSWNGSTYSFYDPSLVAMYGFDRFSAIGEKH